MTKAASSNVFKKAAQFAGIATKPYPGLEPEAIVNALTESKKTVKPILKEEDIVGNAAAGAKPTSNLAAPSSTDIAKAGQENMKASVEKINKAMTALHQFATKSSAVQSSPTEPTVGSKPQGQQNQASSETTGTGASTGANEASGPESDVLSTLNLTKQADKETVKKVLGALIKAGYTITKN